MPFDGLVTSALVFELNNILEGGRIDKIHQPLREELFFQINSNREKHTLFMSANSGNPRVYLTKEKSQNPANAPSFCMLLRKHLLGGRIASVTQHQSDRVIEFNIVGSNELGIKEPKKLIVEIMGKHSNVILIDGQTNVILDSIKHVSIDMSRERQLLPKMEYVYPPTNAKISFYDVNEDDFDINNIQGISKAARIEVEESANPPKKLLELVDRLRDGNIDPTIYYDELKKPVEFYAFPLNEYDGAKYRKFDKISSMLDSWYSTKSSSNRMNQKSADMLNTLKKNKDKLLLKKQRLLEDVEKAKKGDTWKLYGELLTANLHNIKNGQEYAVLTDYYTNKDVTIHLNTMITPSDNAQAYFKKYNKSKTALKQKATQLEETEESINMIDIYITYINNAEKPEEIDELRDELSSLGYLKRRKNQQPVKRKKNNFLTFEVHDGYTVKVGRNNRENDELTMKTAGANDIWFHTKDIPGSHVILFTGTRKPNEKTILETASIAAYYSKGRESQNVPVDYTRVKHVKKPSGAKLGMVIFKDNKTVWVNPKKPMDEE